MTAPMNEVIFTGPDGVELHLKREDLLHPEVSGNKFRKLKYNIQEANELGFECWLTFGGAYSNHIAAVAAAGDIHGVRTIGVIRGEELASMPLNPTLQAAVANGMTLHFVSRADYKRKTEQDFLNGLRERFGAFYLIPEGGTNTLAVAGCSEILTPDDAEFDYICCAVGTGGTLAGLSFSARSGQEILGFPALNARDLSHQLSVIAPRHNWELIHEYHFGGYAKVPELLVRFINNFRLHHKIQLDPVYTGKMMFGICDMIQKSRFPRGTKILAIHTGGLQGIAGINLRLEKSNQIKINDD